MDGDLGTRMKEVLSDPDMMQKLSALAASLSASPAGSGDPAPEHDAPHAAPPAAPKDDRDRARLLSALLPYLNEERRSAAKAMLRVLRLWELIDFGSILGG